MEKSHFKCSNKIQWFYWVVLRASASASASASFVGIHTLTHTHTHMAYFSFGWACSCAQKSIADMLSLHLYLLYHHHVMCVGWCERSYREYTLIHSHMYRNITSINSSDSSWSTLGAQWHYVSWINTFKLSMRTASECAWESNKNKTSKVNEKGR